MTYYVKTSQLRSLVQSRSAASVAGLAPHSALRFFSASQSAAANFERAQHATNQEELEQVLGRPNGIPWMFGFRLHPQWIETELSLADSFATTNRISARIEHDGSVTRLRYDQYPLSFLGWLNDSFGIVVLAMAYIVLATVLTPLLRGGEKPMHDPI